MKITKLFNEFFESEKAGGITLIITTIISLLLVNVFVGNSFTDLFHYKVAGLSIEHWVNDGLMAIFFLLIGLELEREIYIGELSDFKNAALPIVAALGGMAIPASIYLIMNFDTDYTNGAGIPMATDIAFAIGILSLLGSKIPVSYKIFLTALAVIDDLGAIIIIAIFYTKNLAVDFLLISLGVFVLLLVLNRLKIRNLIPYLIGGVIMWFFMLKSGVHATITGVLLAFAIPFGNGDEKSTSYVLQHFLHKPVAFFILPIFALVNTAIALETDWNALFKETYVIGIMLGLLLGKPLGILLFSRIAVTLGLCKLPSDMSWQSVTGLGFLSGIGFTMSIFITLLAFDDVTVIKNAKFIIIITSTIAGILGFSILKIISKKQPEKIT